MSEFVTSIDASLVGGILAITVIDLVLRLWIFGQLESVAIDIAVFSLGYAIVEVLNTLASADQGIATEVLAEQNESLLRLGGIFVCLAVLAVLHQVAAAQQGQIINDQLKAVRRRLATETHEAFDAASPLIRRSVLVVFTSPRLSMFRFGKRRWREEVVELVAELQRLPGRSGTVSDRRVVGDGGGGGQEELDTLTEASLMLPRGLRNFYLTLFVLFGAASVVILAIP